MSDLARRKGRVVVETIEEVVLPKFLQAEVNVIPNKSIKKRNTQLLFLSLAGLVLALLAFSIGRLSTGFGKQNQAQEHTKTQSVEIMGTPNDYIKASTDEFAKALVISGRSNLTPAEKESLSQSILHVLDTLTKGIAAYPDVAPLYFERAQIEKQVMQSAPTLKDQAGVDYKKAIDIAPLTADYYSGYGDYLEALGQKTQASENYQKALQLDPKNQDAQRALKRLVIN